MTQTDQKEQLFDTYTLTGKGEILEKLRMMEKHKILLTALASGESSGFLTTIVKVCPEKGLLALDPSANKSLNNRLLGADGVSFTAQVNGVTSRFSVSKIGEATLNGQSVFAVPIPESLFWLQRRRFYRVPIPYSMIVKCQIPLEGGEIGEFGVSNLSLRGLALIDRSDRIGRSIEIGHVFQNCRLDLPIFGAEQFALELRNKLETAADVHHTGLRLGFAFHGISRNFEIHMQKFMYELEIQKKQADSLVRS